MSDCDKLRKQLKRTVYSKKLTLEQRRENYESFFTDVFLPNDVDSTAETFAGSNVLIFTPIVKNAKNCVLYFHGGFFQVGSQKSYSCFCASLANACQAEVILPEILPTSEKQFPFQLEQAYRLYQSLQKSERFAGYDFVFAGDGSGANLCFALLLYVQNKKEKPPVGISVMSPFVDMRLKKNKNKDGILTFELLDLYAKSYAGSNDLAFPLISPVCATNEQLQKFPFVFIQATADEYLFEQIAEFASQLERANVKTEFEVFNKCMYMFQLFPDACEKAHLAVESFAKKIMQMFARTFAEKNNPHH